MVVVGAVDVVEAVGRVVAERRCVEVEVEVAEVSRTTKVVAAARTATTMTATAVTLPDGGRLGLLACRAMGHSFALPAGDQKSDLSLTGEDGVLRPQAYTDRLARRR